MRVTATSIAAHGARRAVGAVVLLTVIGGLTARALGWGQVVLDACVPVTGPASVLGLHLSLLRDSVSCPEGTLAVTPAGGVVASVALGTLLVALMLLGGGVTLAGLVARAVRVARRTLAAVLPGSVDRRTVLPPVVSFPVTGTVRSWIPARRTHGAHRHRGPPAVAA
ncbi:hypothetical protein GALL_397880 [mine drainage metagenome]|uniref:Uncharacterized protein n=1 Tax=mine drainage metagenome TaxID=410659 RepID=A0A1J5QEU4_9ZZZZ